MTQGEAHPNEPSSPTGLGLLELEQYRTEGFVVLPSFFAADEVAPVIAAIDTLLQRRGMNRALCEHVELETEAVDGRRPAARIYHPFELHHAFRELAGDDRLLDQVESVIGPDINLQHSKVNLKPARVGSSVPWHQDLAYFPQTNDDLATVFVYLDDADEENGCLRVLPRQHHRFFDHHRADGSFTGEIAEDLDSGRWGAPVALPAPAGSVVMMHCNTPHSSSANRSTRPRRAVIVEYRAADAFPIYFDPEMLDAKCPYRLLRGERARYARFGGPRPYIPVIR